MGAYEQATEAWDDLAAGDEVAELEGVLRTMSGQLESLGSTGESAVKPTAHISVPGDGTQALPLPAGRATIDFQNGRVEHPDVDGYVTTDVTPVSDLSRQFDTNDRALETVIFETDTNARIYVDNNEGQSVPLTSVPLPSRPFNSVDVELDYPGNLYVLASTKRLDLSVNPRGLFAGRYGTVTGTLDNKTPVPLSPYGLAEQGQQDHNDPNYWGNPKLWAAGYPASTWTIANNSGNGNELKAVVEGKGPDTPGGTASWYEVASDTVPDGDHSFINVTDGQRHNLLRCRVTNTTAGETVTVVVEQTEASP